MEKRSIKMYGFEGTVQQVSNTEFKVKVNGEVKDIKLSDEKWNDGFEFIPHEIAFTKALDELGL